VGGVPVVRIDGMGHELHAGDWDEIITAIDEHTQLDQADGVKQ
jgi:hypothetical protein